MDFGDHHPSPNWAVCRLATAGGSGCSAGGSTSGPPDLAPLSIVGPSSVEAGATVTVTTTDRNLGSGVAAAGVGRVALSADLVCSGTDRAVGVYDGPDLAPGETVEAARAVLIGTDVAPGAYHWCLISDPLDDVVEENESNNAVASSGTVMVVDGAPGSLAMLVLPNGVQSITELGNVDYAIKVTDAGGGPVNGATIWITDGLMGTSQELTTNASGVATDRTTAPSGSGGESYDVSFRATKPGWTASSTFTSTIQVENPTRPPSVSTRSATDVTSASFPGPRIRQSARLRHDSLLRNQRE